MTPTPAELRIARLKLEYADLKLAPPSLERSVAMGKLHKEIQNLTSFNRRNLKSRAT